MNIHQAGKKYLPVKRDRIVRWVFILLNVSSSSSKTWSL